MFCVRRAARICSQRKIDNQCIYLSRIVIIALSHSTYTTTSKRLSVFYSSFNIETATTQPTTSSKSYLNLLSSQLILTFTIDLSLSNIIKQQHSWWVLRYSRFIFIVPAVLLMFYFFRLLHFKYSFTAG